MNKFFKTLFVLAMAAMLAGCAAKSQFVNLHPYPEHREAIVQAPPAGQDEALKQISSMGQTASLEAKAQTHLAQIIKFHYYIECIRNGNVVWTESFNNRTTTVGLNLYLTDALKNGTGSAAWYVGLIGPDYATATGVITSTTTLTDTTNSPFVAGDSTQPILIKGAAAGADAVYTMTYSSSSVVTISPAATNGTYQYLMGCRLADTMASHSPWAEIVPYSNGTRVTWTGGTVAAGSVDNSASPAAFTINATATVYGAFLVDNSTKSGSTGNLFGMGVFAASRGVLTGDTLNVTITCSIS